MTKVKGDVPALRVELLGPVRACRGEEELELGGPQRRALLSMLASARRVVSREEVIDGLWGHEVPSKCSASGTLANVVVLRVLPTTQTSLAEEAEIACPALGAKSGSGNAAKLQAVPFQWASPWAPPLAAIAHALAGLRSATPVSVALDVATASAASGDQALPFQCSSTACRWRGASTSKPTAHASVALLAPTAVSALAALRAGTGTGDHADPFQWYVTGGGAGCPAKPNCCPTTHASVLVRANAPFKATLSPIAPEMDTGVHPPAADAGLAPAARASAPATATSVPAADAFPFRNISDLPSLGAPAPTRRLDSAAATANQII